jgi:hypothetical protein
MATLTRSALLSNADYARERDRFRTQALAERTLRTIPLGAHAALSFENALSVQYRVQEFLLSVDVSDEHVIGQALDDCRLLLPDGDNLKAVLRIAFADPEQQRHLMPTLGGIEQHVYAEVEGLGRSHARVLNTRCPGGGDVASVTQLLCFAFDGEQIDAIRAGAEFGFGIDDARMRVGHSLKRATRAALLADLD